MTKKTTQLITGVITHKQKSTEWPSSAFLLVCEVSLELMVLIQSYFYLQVSEKITL